MSDDTITFLVIVGTITVFYPFWLWITFAYCSKERSEKREKKAIEKRERKAKERIERSADFWGDF